MVSQDVYPRIESSDGILGTMAQMVAMMKHHGYKGLAAPQVGILQQLVVVRLEDGRYLDLVNPVITRMYGAEFESLETCISCPPRDNGCKVARMQIIHVTASRVQQLDSVVDLRFKGPDARLIQHEIDHLEGTFFFERASIKDKVDVIQRYKNWQLTHRQETLNGSRSDITTQDKAAKTDSIPIWGRSHNLRIMR